MLILPRYLYRLFLPSFILCVGGCTGVLLMNQFLRLFNLAVMKGISPLWILACFARLLPSLLALAMPIAFLVALLLTLGGLSENGEVMALRSSGFSFREILQPFFYLSVALSVLMFYVNHKAGPEGYHSFKNSREDALAQLSRLDLEPGAFNALGDWSLYPKEIDEKTGAMRGVYLIKLRGDRVGLRVEAPEGRTRLEKGRGFWMTLYRGSLYLPQDEPSRLVTVTFSEYQVKVPLAAPQVSNRIPDIQELNTPHLRELVRDPETDVSHRKDYLTEMTVRTSGALTPFVFFWLACPLGLRLEKHARATGFALSLLVLFLYYGLLAIGIGLGRRHLGLSTTGPWLPVFAGLVAGAAIWRRNLRI